MRHTTPHDHAIAHAAQFHDLQLRRGMLPNQRRVLYHCTPVSRVPSILERGLLVAYSAGALPVVWLCTPGMIDWSRRHVEARHGVTAVAVFRVEISRQRVVRYSFGQWFSRSNIGPDVITVWS